MLTNNFLPIDPEVLKGLPSMVHATAAVDLECRADATQSARLPTLAHVAHCYQEVGGQLAESSNSSAVLEVMFYDHFRSEVLTLALPIDSEHALSLNNGPIAQLMLLDHFHKVQVMTTRQYPDSTFGAMSTFSKRSLELTVHDASNGAHLHTFWVGDLVQTPRFGNHTSSQGENA